MLLVITFLVLAAAAALVILVRRRERSDLLEAQRHRQIDGENLRPLFAPDEDELAREEREKAQAETDEAERIEAQKKLASFEEFRQTWRELPDRANTVELLFRASEMESGELYLDTVDELLHKRPEGLSADELAELIDSHFWLLPQTERTPGAAYTIKRELAALRGGSAAGSEEADHKS